MVLFADSDEMLSMCAIAKILKILTIRNIFDLQFFIETLLHQTLNIMEVHETLFLSFLL